MALINLQEYRERLIKSFEEDYLGLEIDLPEAFKKRVDSIFSDTITYNKYSALITSKSGLKIYLPNQWFYIASYFTHYFIVLFQYREIVLKIFSQERLKTLKGNKLTNEERDSILNNGFKQDLDFIEKFVTDYNWWGGGKTVDRGDFYISPILNMAKLVNASTEYIAILCAYLASNTDLIEVLHDHNERAEKKEASDKNLILNLNLTYNKYITSIRTKPFVLLAGISGIGKSRIVRELAFMTCPKLGNLQNDETTPGNYCMIEVKPNWHDSAELLGYASGIKDKYIVTPFIKFLVKAMRYPNVPFFICLDEMNLAPVEQYFAEYLSVLETRKIFGDKIISGSLINKDIFINYKEEIYEALGLGKEEFNTEDEFAQITEIKNELEKFGLCIPQNVIVIGTVNMDDTTHQFSRKVIDRAMTIEMNNVNFKEMFSNDDMFHYFDSPVPFEQFISDCVSAKTAFEFIPEEAEILKSNTINVMNILDKQLRDTPFRVAYRVQNELILYFRNMRYIYPEEEFEKLFSQTVDAILNMKVLPRIEGDEDLVEKPLKDLEPWCKEQGYQSSLAKINEMLSRLKRTHYTSYWP